MLEFKPLVLSMRESYLNCFHAAQERAADYSFINIWAWNEERRYEAALYEDLYWLRLTKKEPYELWAPVGNWMGRSWRNILGEVFPKGATFRRVPEKLTRILQEELGDMIEVSEQRSQWEYLYLAKELIALSGNRFHKKKNLLNQFMNYEPIYEEIYPEIIGEVRMLQFEWCSLKNYEKSKGLTAENIAITRILSDWEKMPGITGGALRIDGKLVAYTIAEDIGDGTVIIHFEKGLNSYKGVYQGINQIFLASSERFSVVNREQDMGLLGIRQAKLTYNPLGFIRKYTVKWKR